MKVTAERIENHKVVLEIEVPKEDVKKAINKAYKLIAEQRTFPGFRKGKATKEIINAALGQSNVYDEAANIIADDTMWKALEEQNIVPVSRPEMGERGAIEEGKDFTYKFTVVAKPEVKLGDYKGLKVEKTVEEVTDEKVMEQITKMQENAAKLVVAEGAALAKDDFAVIDFTGYVDGVAFEGGEGKGYPLQIGSGSFIPGFEDQLIGAKAGEERDVNVTFPEEYHSEDLAGKVAVFKVKVNDVKRRQLPELNDEFVKEASSFETVDELKADIKVKLEKNAQQKAESDFRVAVLKMASDNAEVDIPEVMVEARISQTIQELDMNLRSQGMGLEQYMEYTKTDMAKLRENYKEVASVNVKTDLVLEAIAKAEEIKVENEDIQNEIVTMATAYGAKPKEVMKIIQEQGRIGDLAATIMRKKAAKLVVDSVVA